MTPSVFLEDRITCFGSGYSTGADELQAEPVPEHAQPRHLPRLRLRQLGELLHAPGPGLPLALLPGPQPEDLLRQLPQSSEDQQQPVV